MYVSCRCEYVLGMCEGCEDVRGEGEGCEGCEVCVCVF